MFSEGDRSDGFEAVWRRRLHYSVQFFDLDQLTPRQSQHVCNASVLIYLFENIATTGDSARNIQTIFARCQNGYPSLIVLENLCGDDDLAYEEGDLITDLVAEEQKKLLCKIDRDVPTRVISMVPLVRFVRRSLENRLHEKWQAFVDDHFNPVVKIEKLDVEELHEDPMDEALSYLKATACLRTTHNIGPYFVQYTQEEIKSLLVPQNRGVCAAGRIICIESSKDMDSQQKPTSRNRTIPGTSLLLYCGFKGQRSVLTGCVLS